MTQEGCEDRLREVTLRRQDKISFSQKTLKRSLGQCKKREQQQKEISSEI